MTRSPSLHHRTGRSLIAAWGAFLLCAGLGGSGPPEDSEPARLVRQLGSLEYEERQEATERLREIGAPALPFLKAAVQQSADLELKRRAGALVQRIEEQVRTGE